jgi:hypothetical protein
VLREFCDDLYLASPDEIADAMRQTAQRIGRCTLLEMYEWTDSSGARNVEMLPEAWHFSQARVQDLLTRQGAKSANPTPDRPVAAAAPTPAPTTATKPAQAPGPRLVRDVAAELALSV